MKTYKDGRKLRKRMKMGENDKNRVENIFFKKTKI